MQKVHLLWHIIYSWKEPLLIETDMIVPWDIAESDLFFKVMKARAREYRAAAPSCPASTRCILQIRNCIGLPRQQQHLHHHTYTHGHHITAAACCFGIYYTYFCPNGPTLIQSIYVCMWILPLFPLKMAKNRKGARFWQSKQQPKAEQSSEGGEERDLQL